MKHERKQLIHAQFIKQHNKVASLPSCYPAIISFQKHESEFCKGWGSFSVLWSRKKVSFLPCHWNQASALQSDKTWVLLKDEGQSTRSFSTGRSTTGWFTFLSKAIGTGMTVPRSVEVYFSEKTLAVTESDWLCQHQLKCCIYRLPPALLTSRHLLSTQLEFNTDHRLQQTHLSGKHPVSFSLMN